MLQYREIRYSPCPQDSLKRVTKKDAIMELIHEFKVHGVTMERSLTVPKTYMESFIKEKILKRDPEEGRVISPERHLCPGLFTMPDVAWTSIYSKCHHKAGVHAGYSSLQDFKYFYHTLSNGSEITWRKWWIYFPQTQPSSLTYR